MYVLINHQKNVRKLKRRLIRLIRSGGSDNDPGTEVTPANEEMVWWEPIDGGYRGGEDFHVF